MTSPPAEPDPSVPELELEFPPKPEFVRLARHTVGALARMHDVRDDVVDDIKLAVSEACTTAVGSPGAERQPLVIRAWASSTGPSLAIDVADPASAVLREVAGDPSDLDTEDLPFERALALPVIRGLVDQVSVTPRDGGGTTLRMVISMEAPPQ
jgi:serine/threonine-protein kinase RsbW